jgi:hypothetical protein
MALIYLDTISEALEGFSLSKNLSKGKDEPTISKAVYRHLRNKGLRVSYDKQVGFLKFLVDIDYDDGRACIEVKLADKLVNDTGKTGEVQRLFGQIFYYTRSYPNILPVVMALVIGDKSLAADPKIKEIKKCIESLGAEFKYLPTKN